MEYRIRELIDKRGIRHNWIAENILGISRQNFYNKLTGRSQFTGEQKRALADFFCIPVDDLFPEFAQAILEG